MAEREALNMALQALETLMIERGSIYDKAITAIKEALADPSPNFNCKSVQARLATAWGYVKAQPEQEPVAWMVWGENNVPSLTFTKPSDKYVFDSLYMTPPQRTWVGLTDEEISELIRATHNTGSFVRAIEAKLKEKNGL